MSEDTKIIMPESNGVDASTMAMLSNGGCNGAWNNPFMYLILLAFLRNGFFNGDNGGNAQLASIQDTLNSQATNNLVMDAIKGNCGAIADLSGQLGCTTAQMNTILNGISQNICGASNNVDKNFANTNYNMATQFCDTRQSAKDNTAAILSKLDSIEDSRKDREISALQAELATTKARAERQAELAPMMAQINEIRRAQPSTATVQYPQLSVYPSYLNSIYGSSPVSGQIWN